MPFEKVGTGPNTKIVWRESNGKITLSILVGQSPSVEISFPSTCGDMLGLIGIKCHSKDSEDKNTTSAQHPHSTPSGMIKVGIVNTPETTTLTIGNKAQNATTYAYIVDPAKMLCGLLNKIGVHLGLVGLVINGQELNLAASITEARQQPIKTSISQLQFPAPGETTKLTFYQPPQITSQLQQPNSSKPPQPNQQQRISKNTPSDTTPLIPTEQKKSGESREESNKEPNSGCCSKFNCCNLL